MRWLTPEEKMWLAREREFRRGGWTYLCIGSVFVFLHGFSREWISFTIAVVYTLTGAVICFLTAKKYSKKIDE